MNRILHFARRLTVAVLGVFIGLGIYSFNLKHIPGHSLAMPFGFGASVVLSGSMRPAMEENDLLLLESSGRMSQKENWPAVGDIVVYEADGMFITHRVISVDGDDITTQGDANSGADAPVKRSDILAGLVCVVPRGGYAINFLRSPLGIFLLLAVAISITEFSFEREKRKDEEELEELRRQIREEIRELKEKK